MNAHVTKMVDLLFQDIAPSEEVQALHDEVMNNCQERYQDLIESGVVEEEAVAAVLESLKGMDEVLQDYPRKEAAAPEWPDMEKETSTEDAKEERLSFGPDEIRALDFRVTSCDVRVAESEDGRVSIAKMGDVKMRLEDGVLHFSQEYGVQNMFRGFSLDSNPFESFETFGESIRKLAQTLTDGIMNSVVSVSPTVTLWLPRDMRPETVIRTTSGDVTWDGAEPGEVFKVQTTSGDIRINVDKEALLPSLEVSSTSGDLDCQVSAADAKVKTISGDITWRGDAGVLRINTTSGDAEASGAIALTVLHSVSGDLTLDLEDGRKAEVEVVTTSGDTEIRVPRDTEAIRVRLDSVSGDIRLRGVQAADDAPIQVNGKSVSGDLTILK